jgi:tetratricopeptide (TPR) repeat protein
MVRLISIAVASVTLGAALAPAGFAQTLQQRQWCDGKGSVSPDQQISGCTAIIEARHDGPGILANAYNNRAGAYFSLGQHNRAIEDLDRAIELDPNYAHAFNHRGSVHQSIGQDERAIQDFDWAIKLDPKLASAFFHRGNAYAALGQHERAIQDFDQAIKLDPNYDSAFNNRCLNRIAVGQLQEALVDCNQALWLRPHRGRATTLNVRGITYLKMNQLDAAIADFDAALALAAQNPNSLYGRGVSKLKKGDAAGGNADIGAAKAIKADIADEFARYGLR